MHRFYSVLLSTKQENDVRIHAFVPPNDSPFTGSSERSFVRILRTGESLQDNNKGIAIPTTV